jgi:hypothetical protein
MLSGIIV